MTVSRLMAALLFFAMAMPGSANAVDTVVVCPEMFSEELEPWLDHRRGEGFDIAVVKSSADADSLRRHIRDAADEATRYIVLIGDAPAIGSRCDPESQTPIDYHATKVTARFGSTPTMSSDLSFGDFDGDGIPEAVVGRLPVDTPHQLRQAVKRILAYEHSTDFGPWRGQVQLVGGAGGFGMMIDAAIESVTRTVVTNVLPIETKTRVAYASPGHLFCPVGASFTDAVLDNYWQGSRFWVYAGHGQVTELDRFPQTETGIPVLDRTSVSRLNRADGAAPIAILLACYTGAMDAPVDSIAEEMWLSERGPVAVIAGSRLTMPYGNSTAAVGLIRGVFGEQLPRLGDAWLSALGEMHKETSPDQSTSRMMIDALATMVSPVESNLVDERREHMLLYNLIGDPMLTMQHPLAITVSVPRSHAAGEVIEVSVTSPLEGDLSVTIDRPLGAITTGNPNNTTIAGIDRRAVAGETTLSKFALPIGIQGPLVIRAMVTGENAWASGAAQTILRAP